MRPIWKILATFIVVISILYPIATKTKTYYVKVENLKVKKGIHNYFIHYEVTDGKTSWKVKMKPDFSKPTPLIGENWILEETLFGYKWR